MAKDGTSISRTRFWTLARTLSLLVLITGVAITLLLAQNARQTQEQDARARFEFRFQEAVTNIKDRLLDYQQVLQGTAGLFAASKQVERQEFRRYVDSLQLQSRYPGIQGVGYAQVIDLRDRARHIAAIRQEGFPEYTLRPEGERDLYSSILYLEPFDWRNRRAFGFDMYSEPVRRAAMVRARDQGAAAISGKVTLVQETENDVQAGVLLYVPVYRNGMPHETIEQRRANLAGWAYAPFRMNDLMRGILASHFSEETAQLLDLEIYDGDSTDPAAALYDSRPPNSCDGGTAHTLRESQLIDAGGRQWTVSVCSLPAFDSLRVSERARMILVGGLSGSLLLALIVWLLGTARARALALATRMTRAMRVLSDCNMALVQASSEDALLEEICRLLVSTGGYRLAWVGYAEDDVGKTIRPVARAGIDDGYVNAVRATWADTERGRGPTGTAVRLGTVAINQDFSSSPWMAPWRTQAQAHGYRSSIALPFSGAEGVRGVLTIYSAHTGAFSAREVELLQELATDLGYGIEAQRIRAKSAAAEQELEFLARHDPLTRLPNRLLLQERFDEAAQLARGNANGLALLFLDMDNFKQVNDTFGHQVGDQLLVRVTERLRRCMRGGDTISRQGGDEFVILASDTEVNTAAEWIARQIVDLFGEPFEIEGYPIHASFSIGITVFERDGTDFQVLLKRADAALYQAKEAGRNTWRFFNEKMGVDAREELQMRGELRTALKNGDLTLHFQPQFDLRDGRIIGAEALVRWCHPERGFIPPSKFIPVAERSGIIFPLGDWVLHEACRQMRTWSEDGLPPMTIAVNLSAMQLRNGNILDTVLHALDTSQLPPHQLELELTESMLLQDAEETLTALAAWKLMGIHVSVDDFGTGYSSLSYLTRLAVDKLKVDQSFVRGVGANREDSAVVRAIIQMGHTLGLTVIAEGVETEEQLSFLRENGCDEVQGYLYSRPLPPEEFTRFVRASEARAAAQRRGDAAGNHSTAKR